MGTGEQSVAEHLFRTAVIGYILARLTPKAKVDRVIFLCLMHDIGEARTSDLNYVHQRYGRLAESQAVADLAKTLPFGKDIKEAYSEEQARKTLEAKIAKDADQIEWIVTLRGEGAKGNTKTKDWIKTVEKRMATPAAKRLTKLLVSTHPDRWWFDIKDKWFLRRDPKFRSWKKK
ncbi:MAG: HD domain-containing protein [Patescibacteria group bacterium]